MVKPTKGEYGYLQGTCDKCGETSLPLVRLSNQIVCDSCSVIIDRTKKSVKKHKQVEQDNDFIKRFING